MREERTTATPFTEQEVTPMTPDHHDFHPLETPAQLLEAAARAGLQLSSARADFDRSGLDFLVLHAEDTAGVPWVVRTPRRPDVVEAARVEGRILALVRPALPVAVPHWQIHTPEVIAYPRLGGEPAIHIVSPEDVTWRLDPANPPAAFLESFARALAALQRVPSAEGLPTKSIAEARARHARAMEATRDVLQPSEAVWARWQRWLEDDAMWPRHVALVHGDLHPGHMLLDEGSTLVGILDWTEAHFGDPGLDFAMAFGCFGAEVLEALVARFEAAGGTVWPGLLDHAAEQWAAFPALGALWGLEHEQPWVVEHSKAQLEGIAAAMTPG